MPPNTSPTPTVSTGTPETRNSRSAAERAASAHSAALASCSRTPPEPQGGRRRPDARPARARRARRERRRHESAPALPQKSIVLRRDRARARRRSLPRDDDAVVVLRSQSPTGEMGRRSRRIEEMRPRTDCLPGSASGGNAEPRRCERAQRHRLDRNCENAGSSYADGFTPDCGTVHSWPDRVWDARSIRWSRGIPRASETRVTSTTRSGPETGTRDRTPAWARVHSRRNRDGNNTQ